MQNSRAFVRAPPGDGFPEPWAHAGRHHGDPRLARYCVRGNRPVINLSGPIRDESLKRNVRQDDLPLPIDHDADGVRQEGTRLAYRPLVTERAMEAWYHPSVA